MDGRGARVTISWWRDGCWSQTFCSRSRIWSAESVSRRRGRGRGRPLEEVKVDVRVRLVEIWRGRWCEEMLGEAEGDGDMSWSEEGGSSEALRLREEDMLGL